MRQPIVYLASGLALLAGCYLDHGIDRGSEDASTDPGDADAGVPRMPCTTTCEPARAILQGPIGFGPESALLDMVWHQDTLVIAAVDVRVGTEGGALVLLRLSPARGTLEAEAIPSVSLNGSISDADLRSDGETLSLLVVTQEPEFVTVQPRVEIRRWGSSGEPVRSGALWLDPQPRCPCARRGVAEITGAETGVVALGGEGVLHVGRVDLRDGTARTETLRVDGVIPSSALGATDDGRGGAMLTIGGLRDTLLATASPAYALAIGASSTSAPMPLPGTASDGPPLPVRRTDGMEIVRFVRETGLAGGGLSRFAVRETIEPVGAPLPLAGGLNPLAMAATRSELLWAESSLARVGESDLRVLAEPPASCESPVAASSVHLPLPLAAGDPSAMVATAVEGRTYVALVVENEPFGRGPTLLLFDLGSCRDG